GRMTARAALVAFVAAAGCGNDHRDAPPTCSDATGWSEAPAVLGGPVQETAVVALDGQVFVIGGFDAAGNVVSSVRIFDAATCAWSNGAALPRPIHHANAAVAGGTIYIVGALELNFVPIGDVYAWNPQTDASWATKTSMPAGSERGAAAVGVIGDVIYVAGGNRGNSVSTFSAYSTTSDSWDT